MIPLRTIAGALLIATSLVLCLAACSPSSDTDATSTDGPTPAFTGPWAAEFQTAYAWASTDVVREVLKDSKVTDAEWAELKNRFETCMADRGFPLTWDDDYGGFGLDGDTWGNAQADDALKTCGASIDPVIMMRYAIARNPQNLDESEIVVACFIKNGIVGPGYTTKQYELDSSADPLPTWLAGGDVLPCQRDPLGLLH